VIGVAEFRTTDIETVLDDLRLPHDTALSVIAVELLPGDALVQREVLPWALGAEVPHKQQAWYVMFDQPEMAVGSFGVQEGTGAPVGTDAMFAVGAANARVADPLGRQLGDMTSRRILRCSPLTPVAPSC
jgi:hypothetical protein